MAKVQSQSIKIKFSTIGKPKIPKIKIKPIAINKPHISNIIKLNNNGKATIDLAKLK